MKTVHYNVLAALIISAAGACLYAGKKKAVHKTAVTSCVGGSCSAVVNAIGDPAIIDVSKLAVTPLGEIAAEKAVDIVLPQKPGEKTVYSFIPSTGESAKKLVHLVFDNIPQRAGTRLAGKTQIKIYRKFADQKESEPWIELGRIETDATSHDPVSVIFKPDGTAVWTDQAGKATVFEAGKQKIAVKG